MQLSTTSILVAIELGFVLVLARRCARLAPSPMGPVYLYVSWLAAYAVVTSALGARGVYLSGALLETLPGLWLQLVSMAAIVLPVVAFRGVRDGMRRIVDHTPWHWFAYFHGLRIASLGTAYKTLIGEFPAYFEYGVGVGDFLFGVSAFWIARRARRGEVTERGFMLWNLLGALVIVPGAPILLQLGLPGPLQVFEGLPDARVILTHPMSIAPMIGVPMFVSINLWVAWRLWERGRGAPARSTSN